MNNKEAFIEVFTKTIKREGSGALLDWLQKSDFFISPASTRFHGAYEGGLVEHSLNVYKELEKLHEASTSDAAETNAICALLHDVCKANFYKTDYRNAKDANGVWQKVPFYAVEDQLPYGHGEKSVYIISGFMRLSREEAMAIRWHMGGFDDSVRGGSYSMGTAYEKYPLAVYLHAADILATYTRDGAESV